MLLLLSRVEVWLATDFKCWKDWQWRRHGCLAAVPGSLGTFPSCGWLSSFQISSSNLYRQLNLMSLWIWDAIVLKHWALAALRICGQLESEAFQMTGFSASHFARRDLLSWCSDMTSSMTSEELAKDVAGAEALLEKHKERKVVLKHCFFVIVLKFLWKLRESSRR